MKHLNCIETFNQIDFDYAKDFTHTDSSSENNNFYIPLISAVAWFVNITVNEIQVHPIS